MNNEPDLIPRVELNRLIQLKRDEFSSVEQRCACRKVSTLTKFMEIRKKIFSIAFAQSQKILNITLESYYIGLDYKRTQRQSFLRNN